MTAATDMTAMTAGTAAATTATHTAATVGATTTAVTVTTTGETAIAMMTGGGTMGGTGTVTHMDGEEMSADGRHHAGATTVVEVGGIWDVMEVVEAEGEEVEGAGTRRRAHRHLWMLCRSRRVPSSHRFGTSHHQSSRASRLSRPR